MTSAPVAMLAHAARAKHLELQLRVDERVPATAAGDPARIRQILVNFIGNAIKFTERGTVAVYVTVEDETATGIHLRFAVTDTGIGLSPEAQDRLFQPFSQADASTTRKFGGTGLGLAISRRLAELMGGAVGVESRLGTGSTFWLAVPLQRAAGLTLCATQPPLNRPEVSRGQSGESLRQGVVLAAEDNQVNRMLLGRQLDRLGYRYEMVANGSEAVEAIERSEFDAVLMDCQMPEMDGFEATAAIRRSDKPDIPIIAMTANSMEGDRERCLEAGMSDYISKPITLSSLEAALARWIRIRADAAA